VGPLRHLSLAVVAMACGLLATPVAQQKSSPERVRILVPEPDSYVSGPFTLRADVEPQTLQVAEVSFFANGQLACRVVRRPYNCPFDAGPGVVEHQFRVVAALTDGRRLVATVRTKGAEYAETVDVDAIQVTVTVTDDRGQFVRNLKREQFQVFEDDAPQKTSYFAAAEIPLELTAAVDVSGSMIEAMPQLKIAVRRFLSALRPSDQVSLLAFNDNVFTLARASTDPAVRLKAVDRLAAWGGTALYDVIVRSVEGLSRQVGRRTLVMFSDGEDTASHVTLDAAEKRLQTSDATVYTIAQGRATRLRPLREILERIAKTSGGRSFVTRDMDALAQSYDEIVRELSNQYLLAYAPPSSKHDGAWHRIRVRVNPDRYRVRAREGYRTPTGAGR
jgi:Ca-activated chloride channel family protein